MVAVWSIVVAIIEEDRGWERKERRDWMLRTTERPNCHRSEQRVNTGLEGACKPDLWKSFTNRGRRGSRKLNASDDLQQNAQLSQKWAEELRQGSKAPVTNVSRSLPHPGEREEKGKGRRRGGGDRKQRRRITGAGETQSKTSKTMVSLKRRKISSGASRSFVVMSELPGEGAPSSVL